MIDQQRHFFIVRESGQIDFSEFTFDNGFQMRLEFEKAQINIGNSQPLTFFEEYSICLFWHLTMHLNSIIFPNNLTYRQKVIYEAIAEFYARGTYVEILRSIGAAPRHFDRIQTEGFYFQDFVLNFRLILDKFKIDKVQVLNKLRPILLDNSPKRAEINIKPLILSEPNSSDIVYNELINNIDFYNKEFDSFAKDLV